MQWYLANQAWVEGVTSGAYRQWVGKQYGASEHVAYDLHALISGINDENAHDEVSVGPPVGKEAL